MLDIKVKEQSKEYLRGLWNLDIFEFHPELTVWKTIGRTSYPGHQVCTHHCRVKCEYSSIQELLVAYEREGIDPEPY